MERKLSSGNWEEEGMIMELSAEGRGDGFGLKFFMKMRRSLEIGSILVINFQVKRLKENG